MNIQGALSRRFSRMPPSKIGGDTMRVTGRVDKNEKTPDPFILLWPLERYALV